MIAIAFCFTKILALFSATVTNGQYISTAELHPNCLKVQPTERLSTEWGLRLFAGANFYIPFGHGKAIEHISSLIYPEGRSSKSDSSGHPKMCAHVGIRGFKLRMDGHGDHYLIQDCSVIKKGVNHCIVNSLSENTESQKPGDGIFTIVWTDNQSAMAVVRCTSDGLHNDWYVFSTATSLNDTVKETIVESMKNLGFPYTISDTTSPSYEGCELFEQEEES